MKPLVYCLLLACAGLSDASTNINGTNAFSYGGNVGFLNWRPSSIDGVSLGAYVTQGRIYSSNVGWIDLGNGNPVNHIQYGNNTAGDYGVNFTVDPNNMAHGLLRGFAYGANVGWLNFENLGNPYVIISNGQLRGYVWSANLGWINLDDLNVFVAADTIDPGIDTDGDRLPDAWEYTYFGNLSSGADVDLDGDGETNLAEYKSKTSPVDPTSVLRSARQLNISTRLRVLTDDNVLIGGFIVAGPEPKKVIARALGPSLTAFGVPGALEDPTLELHDPTGAIVALNDNWKDSQAAEIQAIGGVTPTDSRESAIVATLAPGAYTVIVKGAGKTTGVGLVEVYDLATGSPTKLSNISTRGFVDKNDNVMIGGFIVGAGLGNGGAGSERIFVRALGRSLEPFGITNALQNPTLELRDGNGALLVANDDWKQDAAAEIQATGIAPSEDQESAIVRVLSAGAYTVIVRGKDNGTGVGLVEVYNLP